MQHSEILALTKEQIESLTLSQKIKYASVLLKRLELLVNRISNAAAAARVRPNV